jgi:hypothetical protein
MVNTSSGVRVAALCTLQIAVVVDVAVVGLFALGADVVAAVSSLETLSFNMAISRMPLLEHNLLKRSIP